MKTDHPNERRLNRSYFHLKLPIEAELDNEAPQDIFLDCAKPMVKNGQRIRRKMTTT